MGDATASPLRGAAARVVANMTTSLTVPTATSVRAVPAKLMADNRVVINNHLRRARGGKISYTHLIGYAIVKALAHNPEMNSHFAEIDGRPTLVTPEHVNLGIAIDLVGKDDARSLIVANIKHAETMSFAEFWSAYEDIIRRARSGKLSADDFAGTTITLTNPGTIGTNHSVPRLMEGQGTIIGVGAMEYPAEFSGMSREMLAERAISKIMTLTSTYDHRIIQGAQSGEFLRRVHELLLADEFYDEIFAALTHSVRAGAVVGRPGVHSRGPDRQERPGDRAHQCLPHQRPPDGRHGSARVHRPDSSGPGHHPARTDAVGPGPRSSRSTASPARSS